MKQEDVELYAFLFFAGSDDRDLLLEKKEMTCEDFFRLVYLTDLLGLHALMQALWNRFGDSYLEKTARLENALEREIGEFDLEEDPEEEFGDLLEKQERWVEEFCVSAVKWKQKRLRKIMEEIRRQKEIY